jgi:tRNA (mo5U34)-methyltransferase
MDLKKRLQEILDRAGPENIWRPVIDPKNEVLAKGIEDMRDGNPRVIAGVSFQGKSVLDMGCNFGFYSFFTRRLGASRVVGVDMDGQAIAGCEILKKMYGLDHMTFRQGDFTSSDFVGTYDVGLLINFIGKAWVNRGIESVLAAAKRLILETLLITIRPTYKIGSHLKTNTKRLSDLYGDRFVGEKRFHLEEYVRDYFGEPWHMTVLSPDYGDPNLKRTFRLTRKSAGQ